MPAVNTRGRVAPRGRSASRLADVPPSSPDAESFPEPNFTPSDDDNISTPPVITSPIKRRSRNIGNSINNLGDLDVWGKSDTEIIEAARLNWRSEAYDHYNVTLMREVTPAGIPKSLTFTFTCKYRPDHHKSIMRPRCKTSAGTGNLVKSMKACLKTLGQSIPIQYSPDVDAIAMASYTPASHRALIALRCAKYTHPFNMVQDDEYVQEVTMLRPNTIIPNPSTISRDIKLIYTEMSKHVQGYFRAHDGPVHLVLDGWTSPLVWSYLGLVVVWHKDGKIHRAILEFIRLTSKHDGKYLADVVGQCVTRFGLQDRLFSVCMDNATNCDKLAEELPNHLPQFPGKPGRLRCLAHIFNLIAKIFISFFFKKPRTRKRVGIAQGETGAKFRRPGESDDLGDEDELVIDEGDEIDSEEDDAVLEEVEATLEEEEDDEGQSVHNERVAKTLREKAIRIMRQKGILLRSAEEKIALQIFPRVAGLARRVHDSSPLKEKFDQFVNENEDLEGDQCALTRRVPTHWNSDLACLMSHFHFKDVVEQLTSVSSLKLKSYKLSTDQWKMAEDVREVLLLFDAPTKIFSSAEVPLIVNVIPSLEEIREGLIGARDDNINEVSNVVKIACQASIMLIDKYSTFAEDCEIYLIAIVMCPDRKLKWFKDHGRNTHQTKDIQKKVVAWWNERYAPKDGDQSGESTPASKTRSRYAATIVEERYPADHIMTYLKEPLLPTATIVEVGGYMHYWHNARSTRPYLARMASDFCSAPATSVDAERAFSTGRRQVNFLQHNMSSQTFKAQMAVGSWTRSPLYPGFNAVSQIVQKAMDRSENPFLANKD